MVKFRKVFAEIKLCIWKKNKVPILLFDEFEGNIFPRMKVVSNRASLANRDEMRQFLI